MGVFRDIWLHIRFKTCFIVSCCFPVCPESSQRSPCEPPGESSVVKQEGKVPSRLALGSRGGYNGRCWGSPVRQKKKHTGMRLSSHTASKAVLGPLQGQTSSPTLLSVSPLSEKSSSCLCVSSLGWGHRSFPVKSLVFNTTCGLAGKLGMLELNGCTVSTVPPASAGPGSRAPCFWALCQTQIRCHWLTG